MEEASASAWLAEHQRQGASCNEALGFFDALPAVPLSQMVGRWKGEGLPTGHPMDGLLEALSWYGKEFVDADRVHPLLFSGKGGIVAVDPARIPLQLALRLTQRGRLFRGLSRAGFSLVRPLLATKRPGARLRRMEHRGVTTATMIYDALPIHDVFRRVDEDTVLGLMELRGLPQPFFFVLRREALP